MSKLPSTNEDFMESCKAVSEGLNNIQQYVQSDEEMNVFEDITLNLTFINVMLFYEMEMQRREINENEDDSSDFKWDDDHTFK